MRSINYRILEIAVRLTGYKKLFSLDAQGLRSYIEKMKDQRVTAPPRFIYKRHQTRELTICGRPCHIIAPADGANSDGINSKGAVLLLHGGGMFMEATGLHWKVASKLVKRLGVTVWLPAYPLIPGHTFRDVTEMLAAVYSKMLENHPAEDIAFLGDSAGAVLGMMLCHYNKTVPEPLPSPKKLVLISPGMVTDEDRELQEEMKRIMPHDRLLSVEFMGAMASIMQLNSDKKDYFSAPLYGDFTGFPDMYVFSGTYEIFYAQMPAFIERARAAGISVEFYPGEKMMHMWPYMPFSRESREALNHIFDIIRTK